MVSVCAGCDGYYPWAAASVAAVAGVLYVFLSKLIISIKVDDPLDAVAVHAGSGLWGILAAPIFMDTGDTPSATTHVQAVYMQVSFTLDPKRQ